MRLRRYAAAPGMQTHGQPQGELCRLHTLLDTVKNTYLGRTSPRYQLGTSLRT